MEIGRITGATRVIGKSHGYYGLPLRDEVINDSVTGPDTPCMVTAWLPEPRRDSRAQRWGAHPPSHCRNRAPARHAQRWGDSAMITTSTRVEDAKLAGLLERVEKATGPDRGLDFALHDLDMGGWLAQHGYARIDGHYETATPPVPGAEIVAGPEFFTASIDAALALVERMLPGWMWRVASCSVSDDAWVCPDFNHPGYGAALQAEFNEAFGGRDPAEAIIEATDVDRRPAGKPALALIQSLLLALILLRSLSQGAGHEQ